MERFLDSGYSSSFRESYGSLGLLPRPRNEDEFVDDIERLYRMLRLTDVQKDRNKFTKPHFLACTFAQTLDEAAGLDASQCMSPVIWSVAFKTYKEAIDAGQRDQLRPKDHLNRFIEAYLPKLASIIPNFDKTQLCQLCRVDSVRRPLREIFDKYIDCYNIALQHLSSANQSGLPTPDHEFDRFSSSASEAVIRVKELVTEWQEILARETQYPSSTPTNVQVFSNNDTIHLSFTKIELIDRGTFGSVYKVRQNTTFDQNSEDITYAQKDIAFNGRSKLQVIEQVKNEVAIMHKLQHTHIVRMSTWTYNDSFYSLFIRPVADCDLAKFLQTYHTETGEPRHSINKMNTWFGCLAAALSFAHGEGIQHKDIKPRNILIKNDRPFLADFGCARDFSTQGPSAYTVATPIGTPVYWAPENDGGGFKSDVFSLGCVFSQMLTVRQGLTLSSYETFRCVQDSNSVSYAFRDNLEKVKEWIMKLEISDRDYAGQLVRKCVLEMLRESHQQRSDSRTVKRHLGQERERLFCSSCD